MNSLVSKLTEKPWRTDILKIQGTKLYISGGERQGLKVGDKLLVMQEGDKVKSGQTGFTITLPANKLATLSVVSLFGSDETNEGAMCEIVTGSIPQERLGLFIAEVKGAS